MKPVNPNIKTYFRKDNAAAVWWNVDNLPRYHGQTTWLGEHFPFHNHRVLDLACGKDRFSILAAQKGAIEVIAVDISKKMLEEARQKAEETDAPAVIRFIESDLETFNPDGLFYCILLMEVLVHLPDPGAAIQRAFDLGTSSGWFATNIDFPYTESRIFQGFQSQLNTLYNFLPSFVRRSLANRLGWPYRVTRKLRLNTVEATLEKLEEDPTLQLSRPDDAYSSIAPKEVYFWLEEAGFKIERKKLEWFFGLPVGMTVVARKP